MYGALPLLPHMFPWCKEGIYLLLCNLTEEKSQFYYLHLEMMHPFIFII